MPKNKNQERVFLHRKLVGEDTSHHGYTDRFSQRKHKSKQRLHTRYARRPRSRRMQRTRHKPQSSSRTGNSEKNFNERYVPDGNRVCEKCEPNTFNDGTEE